MTIDDLLRSGRIRRESGSPGEIRDALKLADRDLRVARKLMTDDADWGFAVAYNAVLQAGRALMFARGYRPASAEGHKSTFAFLAAAPLPPEILARLTAITQPVLDRLGNSFDYYESFANNRTR